MENKGINYEKKQGIKITCNNKSYRSQNTSERVRAFPNKSLSIAFLKIIKITIEYYVHYLRAYSINFLFAREYIYFGIENAFATENRASLLK